MSFIFFQLILNKYFSSKVLNQNIQGDFEAKLIIYESWLKIDLIIFENYRKFMIKMKNMIIILIKLKTDMTIVMYAH